MFVSGRSAVASPGRTSAYFYSNTTLNHIRALLTSGFASLHFHHPRDWSLSHVRSATLRCVALTAHLTAAATSHAHTGRNSSGSPPPSQTRSTLPPPSARATASRTKQGAAAASSVKSTSTQGRYPAFPLDS